MARSGAEAAAEAPRGGSGGAKPPPRIVLQFWQCVLTFQVKCGAKANFKIIETLAPTWGFCALIQCVRSPSSQPQRTMEASQPGPGKSGRNVRSWGGFAACSRPAAMRCADSQSSTRAHCTCRPDAVRGSLEDSLLHPSPPLIPSGPHAWVASCTVGCSPCACTSEGGRPHD